MVSLEIRVHEKDHWFAILQNKSKMQKELMIHRGILLSFIIFNYCCLLSSQNSLIKMHVLLSTLLKSEFNYLSTTMCNLNFSRLLDRFP